MNQLPTKPVLAVIGTGAVGGYYGGLLAQSGLEVHFLLHNDYEHVKKHGLKVETASGGFCIKPVFSHKQYQTIPPCDLVVIALKTTKNAILKNILPSILKPEGCVLVLQNGLGIEETIASYLPNEHIFGGLCFLCSNKVGPGHIHHLDYGRINLGIHNPTALKQSLLFQIQELLANAKIEVELEANLPMARWKKLVWNIPFNGLCTLLNSDTKKLMDNPHSKILLRNLMSEVILAAKANQAILPDRFDLTMLNETNKMEPYLPSMLLDYRRGNPMELETIYKIPLKAAEKANIPMPRVQTLYYQLKYLDDYQSNSYLRPFPN